MECEVVSATTDLYRKYGIGRATLTSGVRRPGDVGSCVFLEDEYPSAEEGVGGGRCGRGDAEGRLQRTDALCRGEPARGCRKIGVDRALARYQVVDRMTPVHTRLRELAARRRRDASLLAFYRACTLMTSARSGNSL